MISSLREELVALADDEVAKGDGAEAKARHDTGNLMLPCAQRDLERVTDAPVRAATPDRSGSKDGADQRAWRGPDEAKKLEFGHGCLLRGLTFELTGRQRQDARPGLAKMYRVPPGRAWWPAVGSPVERGVRRRRAGVTHGFAKLDQPARSEGARFQGCSQE
jgi:hypothetical protein